MAEKIIKVITSFVLFSILVIGVSMYFIFNEALIGPAYLFLGFLGIISLKFFKIKLKEVSPDIIFGAIDNGVLIFAAVLGGVYAGVAGAVLGGAAGNTLTDGLGGFFEGRLAEKLRKRNVKTKRTAFSSMIGKMIGCLIGAGAGLIAVWASRLFLNILY